MRTFNVPESPSGLHVCLGLCVSQIGEGRELRKATKPLSSLLDSKGRFAITM